MDLGKLVAGCLVVGVVLAVLGVITHGAAGFVAGVGFALTLLIAFASPFLRMLGPIGCGIAFVLVMLLIQLCFGETFMLQVAACWGSAVASVPTMVVVVLVIIAILF